MIAKGMPRWLIALALGACSLPAIADELDGRRLTLGGFGTIGLDYHDADGLEYRRSAGQAEGAMAGKIDLATGTMAGVQVNAAWNHQLEVVGQVLAIATTPDEYRPRLTRGFVRYTPDESVMLRFGRIGYELYPQADSNSIGYSSLTVRPPPEMFGATANDDFDGADLTATYPLGLGLVRVKIFGGRTTNFTVLPDGSEIDLSGSKIWGVQGEFLKGPWVLRLGTGWYLVGHPASLAPLSAALRQTGEPQALQLAEEFDGMGHRTSVLTAGLTYDDGHWQGRLYLARTDNGSRIGFKENIGMLSLGYSLGRFTPYALLSRAYNYNTAQSTGLPDNPAYAAINAGAYAAQTVAQINQTTAGAGLRYDFARNMDLKLQIDHVWANESVLMVDHRTPPGGPAELTVFGIAFDFVF